MTSIFAHFNSDLLGSITIRTVFQTSILGQKNQGYELQKKLDRKIGKLRKMSEISREINVAFSRGFFKVPKSTFFT